MNPPFPPMQTRFAPELDSIFGNTYAGVPSPNVPHVHPWPTRYHGPIYTVPDVTHATYVQTPYARTPYMGMGGTAPLFENLTGSSLFDALIGAGVGFLVAPTSDDRGKGGWAIVGALAGGAAGLLGLLGVGAVGLYLKEKR